MNKPTNLPKRGMMVEILRGSDGDCTNFGVTCRALGAKYAVLVGEGIPELFAPTAEMPGLWLERRAEWMGDVARPLDAPDGAWTMFGGHFVYSSDSRFREIVANSPIAVHDRIEGRFLF